MDTPAEAVVAVVGDDMGVVAVVDDVAHLHAVKAGVAIPFEVVIVLLFSQQVPFLVVGVVYGTARQEAVFFVVAVVYCPVRGGLCSDVSVGIVGVLFSPDQLDAVY